VSNFLGRCHYECSGRGGIESETRKAAEAGRVHEGAAFHLGLELIPAGAFRGTM